MEPQEASPGAAKRCEHGAPGWEGALAHMGRTTADIELMKPRTAGVDSWLYLAHSGPRWDSPLSSQTVIFLRSSTGAWFWSGTLVQEGVGPVTKRPC